MTERRQAFRMPAVPDFDQVVLKIRGREVTGRLNDTSLTGLGVFCDSKVQVKVGEKIEVRSDSGWYFVKVARVSTTPRGMLLGLERPLETPEAAKARKDESRLVAVVFGIAVAVAPLLTAAWTYWRSGGQSAANSTPAESLATTSASGPTRRPDSVHPRSP